MKRVACWASWFLVAACGSSSEPASAPSGAAGAAGAAVGPYQPPAASAVVEAGPVAIRRELFTIAGVEAPPNPMGGATPSELNRVRVIRYRVDSDPPRPARAIVVMMPGFLGGGPSFDGLARALVKRSSEEGAIEAWAIDRRSNLLEDHHGHDVAEVRRDPELARRYYVDGDEIEGKTFPGFVTQSSVPYMSEWGLATTLGDLRKVIELVPQAERRSRVVLVGHSLGASIAEAYAAWDFAGTPGYSELAGLVLVDGVAQREGSQTLPDQAKYENGGEAAAGGFGTSPGVNGIRKANRYVSLPFLGTKVYPIAGYVAMRAVLSPDAVAEDPDRDALIGTLLSLNPVPKMTHRAALGLAFDVRSNGLSFAAISCGETDGAMDDYDSVFGGKLAHPVDATAKYGWREFDAVSPREATDLSAFARIWFEGPSIDFAEWYFPQRLPADMAVASSLVLSDSDWPVAAYGLRAKHGAALDLPILALPAGLLRGDAAVYDALRTLVAAAPIGAGRPLAGTPRTSAQAFRVSPYPELTHIDPLTGHDSGRAKDLFDEVAGFVGASSPSGGVSIPVARD